MDKRALSVTADLEPLSAVIRDAVYEGVFDALKDSGLSGSGLKEAVEKTTVKNAEEKSAAASDKGGTVMESESNVGAEVQETKESDDTETEKVSEAEETTAADSEKPSKASKKSEATPVSQTKITHDDLVKIAAKKVKAKKENTDKIGALIQTYGVSNLKDLPEEKFEQFLTDLNQI